MKNLLLLFMLVFTSIAIAQPNINQPDNIIVYEFPFDGFATFDLTINESQTLNGINPTTVTVTYYETLVDAQTQNNPIVNPNNYMNLANPQTIYVNVTEISTNLFSTTSFDIEVSDDVVNIPDSNFFNTLLADGVDTNNSGNIQSFEALSVTELTINGVFDLTGIEAFSNLISLVIGVNDTQLDVDLSSNLALEELVLSPQGFSGADLNLLNNINLKTLEIFSLIDEIDLSNNLLLENLSLTDTFITSLDLNNNFNLTSLQIANNFSLETVFIKNGSDESTNIDSGSWSENWGFGNNPNLEYVCADAFQVTEIQSFAGTDYVVNSFCDFQPGGNYNTITGLVQYDLNNDGCDVSDPFVPYLNIDAGPEPSTLVPAVTTDSIGVYKLYLAQAGDLTIQPNLENPSYFNISPNFPNVNIPFIDNGSTTQDFCLTANGTIADAEVVIAPIIPSRPGFDATYKIVFKNKGNQVLSGSVDFQYDDTVLDFVSSTEVPDFQDSDVLSFNFTNLEPFESRSIDITVNVNGPTETPPINIDDILDYSSTISIDQTEETPDDNTFDYAETIVGAYDPNDITCLQGDLVPETEIGEFLHYMIRFENTGNAPAENVVVTTEINPSDYDVNTLQVLNASHDMFVRQNNGVIEFVFESIQLDGGGGHGNILLKIKTKPELTNTDEVEIQADIYFDFNFPIVTNIANTAFGVLSVNQFQNEVNMSMYPNPASDRISIETSAQIQALVIYDLLGKAVVSLNNVNSKRLDNIDVSSLNKGIYLLSISTDKGRVTKKLIIK